MSSTRRGKLLRISSEDKLSGETNANFSVVLNNTSFIQNIRGIVPKSISFKHVFPNIYDGNHTLSYEYDGTPSSVTIGNAWYDENTLIAVLNTALAADPNITGSVVITLTIVPTGAPSSQNTYFTFTSTDPLTLFNKEDGNSMGDILGIKDTDTGLVLTSEYLPDLAGLSVIYLCSSEMAGNNTAASSSNGEQVAVVTEIPVNVKFGSQVYYRAYDDSLESIIYPSKRSLTKISLQLCTRSGRVLDLQQNNLTCLFKLIDSDFFSTD